MAKTQAKAGYSAKDITVLEGLEPVRLRPGMYIGSTRSRGLPPLVYEAVDKSGAAAPGRAQRAGRRDPAPGQLGDGHRLGLGHPGGRDGRPGPAGPDGRPDEAPCG